MAGPARAGDIALLESLGFSEAGDVFAFQQSGVEDGSGFPYAEIFFLDLKSDRFLEPSPIRVRLNEDGALVADAVAEARAAAADLLTRTMPDKRNGHVVLDNPPTDLSSDGKAARFVARPVLPPIDEPLPDEQTDEFLDALEIARTTDEKHLEDSAALDPTDSDYAQKELDLERALKDADHRIDSLDRYARSAAEAFA